jgi:hypothetical protein
MSGYPLALAAITRAIERNAQCEIEQLPLAPFMVSDGEHDELKDLLGKSFIDCPMLDGSPVLVEAL